jgi:hypothetical protein
MEGRTMTFHDDPHDRAIERRLLTRPAVVPSPGHRSRVLAAVRDVVAARPAPLVARAQGLGGDGVLALAGSAAVVAPLVIGPWCLGLAALAAGTAWSPPARPPLVAQARMVGVDLPPDTLAWVQGEAGGVAGADGEPGREGGDSSFLRRPVDQWLRMRHALVREL